MRRIAFTLCSNNYLARAQVVGDTFLKHHPDYQFFVFLVDCRDASIDYAAFTGITIVEISEAVPNIDELAAKYDIIELNTAVKARVFLHLIAQHDCEWILYLDPDLMIVSRFDEVETLLADGRTNIVITPHGCSPIDDDKVPSEVHIMKFGIYNLGFLAVANTPETVRFLEWWNDRLMKYCYIRTDVGLFTDQIWINWAPAYFEGVHILKHLGYNVSHWNLYEREVAVRNSAYYVSETAPLRFFHFSHYDFDTPHVISRKQNRHTIDDFEHLRLLIDEYQAMLVRNRHSDFRPIRCSYLPLPEPVAPPRTGALLLLARLYRVAHRVAPGPSTLVRANVRKIVVRLRA